MKRIIFVFLLGMGVLHAMQSSCQISLYFANGVLQDKDEPAAKKLWEVEVEKLQAQYPELSASTLLAKTSYNSSYLGGVDDFLEAVSQATAGQALSLVKLLAFENEYALKALEPLNALAQVFNYEDLQTHITAYNQDLQASNGVAVVAHSQGNFFTRETYSALSSKMQRDFEAVSVALSLC